ncbi:MAG: hypothetical protein AB2669_07335 [Candidatus Thiodiazotropha endolucinida]
MHRMIFLVFGANPLAQVSHLLPSFKAIQFNNPTRNDCGTCCCSCTLFIAIKYRIGPELNRDYLNFANEFKVAF